MSNNAALQAVLSMLQDDDDLQKTAAEYDETSVSPEDVYLELGKQAWVDMYKEAHAKNAEVQLEDALAKVAHIMLRHAASQGVVPGIIKQACPNDPDLQAVVLGVIEQAVNA